MPVKPLAAARCSGRSPTSPLAFTSAPNFSSSFATCAVEKEMRFNWVSWAFFPQSGMWKRLKGTFYLLVAVIWGDMQGGKKHGILNVHRRSVLQQYVCCLVGGGLLGICATNNGNWCWTFHLHPLLYHLMVSSQCGHMQGSEGTAAHLLHIWPSVEKSGHQLSVILGCTDKHPNTPEVRPWLLYRSDRHAFCHIPALTPQIKRFRCAAWFCVYLHSTKW